MERNASTEVEVLQPRDARPPAEQHASTTSDEIAFTSSPVTEPDSENRLRRASTVTVLSTSPKRVSIKRTGSSRAVLHRGSKSDGEDSEEMQVEVLGSFWQQIAGHKVVLKARGGKICKPLITRELWFYKSLDEHPSYRPFTARWYGCVDLTQDQLRDLLPNSAFDDRPKRPKDKTIVRTRSQDDDSNREVTIWSRHLEEKLMDELAQEEASSSPKHPHTYLLLQDITYGYKRPCLLDIKLGTRCHGDDAKPSKAASQISKCNATTSASIGVRICGIKTYQPHLKVYREMHKYEGRKITRDNIAEWLANYFHNGLQLRSDIVDGFIGRMQELLAVVEREEVYRIYSSSLLFVYEGSLKRPPKWDVKMIDFAHTYLLDGLEQDDGYRFGLKHLIRLLEEVRSTYSAASAS